MSIPWVGIVTDLFKQLLGHLSAKASLNRVVKTAYSLAQDILLAPVLTVCAVAIRLRPGRAGFPLRVVLGTQPIISLPNIAQSLRMAGHDVRIVTSQPFWNMAEGFGEHTIFYPTSGARKLFGRSLRWIQYVRLLFWADTFVLFFDATFVGLPSNDRLEDLLARIAKRKLVFHTYGSDSLLVDEMRPKEMSDAYAFHYPQTAHQRRLVSNRLNRRCHLRNRVIAHLYHWQTLPRWDVLIPLPYPVDVSKFSWKRERRTDALVVAHSPNHQRLKGTQHLVAAVSQLQSEGLPVILELLENRQHAEVVDALERSHVLVDQLLVAFAMSGLEGMAAGALVIANFDGLNDVDKFARRSDLAITNATPESLQDVLRELVITRHQFPIWSERSRRCAEAMFSIESMSPFWDAMVSGQGVPHGRWDAESKSFR
jgi:hypothetical protein